MTPLLLGCETPRIATPPLRELTRDTTHGYGAIAFAEDILQLQLFPWQKWLLIHGLELQPDGLYRFRTVIVEVARQSGKTLLMIVLALWHVYALRSRTVIGTAQDLANAERAWSEAVEMAQSDEELNELITKITLAHPKVLHIGHPAEEAHDDLPALPAARSEYRVASASRRSARGFSGDLILLDELREHQSWEAWAAISNTMNARPLAQCWAFSNAGDGLSVVLRYLRASAHQALGWPDGDGDSDVLGETDTDNEGVEDLGEDTLGWFEWSVPPGALATDREAWCLANPSLNHVDIVANCVTERALVAALRTSPRHVFETEVLCRWSSISDGGPFPEGTWSATMDVDCKPSGESVCCVEISSSRSQTVITRAGMDEKERTVVGVWVDRAGTDWVLSYLQEHRDDYTTVVVRSVLGAPISTMLEEFADADLPVVEWKGPDIATAHGLTFDLCRDLKIVHRPHPGLDRAATTAHAKILNAGGWVVDAGKSPVDTVALTAAIGAVWGVSHMSEEVSIYAKGESVLVLGR